jgi:hypothetical protein
MLKRLIALSVLAVGSVAVAHADPISGFFSATGTDTFTTSSITFDSAQVSGAIGGTFATYLTDGNAITFAPGSLPYSNGMNTAPPNTTLFSTTENGETFTFIIADYSAQYINNGTNGCTLGSTCLIATGDGMFTGSGVFSGTSGAAVFNFTSQYVPNQPLTSITSFSASSSAVAPPTVPEPASLALVGSGILAIAGFARRKFSI